MNVELPKNKDIIYFAKTHYRNNEKIFGIQRQDRRQHMYILGKSGMGKSTLISNMALQDIRNGDGVCIVDPHGELVEDLLGVIPKERLDDVVYFNPSDIEYHVGFNVLEVYDDRYKHLVASGIMGIFTKIWANVWSSRMEYILNNCILALIDTPGTTLLGIPRLLVDKDYRQTIVNNIKDPVVRTFWIHEYEAWEDRYRKEAIAPIQNKVGQFLSSAIIRNILGQPNSTINIPDIMDKQKIFLVNLSKGRVGEDNSALLGAMLITKLQLAAMERVKIAEHLRKDFYLYVDEFQNFVTDSFATILSEARKYRLNLIIAHQYVAQLETENNTVVRDAVFGNVGTMIIGRVGAADADFLETEFMPEFTPDDFVSLPNYHVYLKLLVNGMTTRPFSAKTLPAIVKLERKPKVEEYIIGRSRKLYHRPRAVVEAEITKWSNGSGEGGESSAKTPINAEGLASDGKYRVPCSFDDCEHIATVPFKPQPGRPVYCHDCIAKIKSGEKKAITNNDKNGKPQIKQGSKADLAALGIEFAPSAGDTKPAKIPKKQEPSPQKPTGDHSQFKKRLVEKSKPTEKPRPANKPKEISKKPPQRDFVSKQQPQVKKDLPLQNQAPRNDFSPKEKTRSGPDREGLQGLLKDALGNIDFSTKKESVVTEQQPQVKKEPQKTISLADLAAKAPREEIIDLEDSYRARAASLISKKPHKPKFDPEKQASQDKVSALRQALAKANSVQTITDTETTQKNNENRGDQLEKIATPSTLSIEATAPKEQTRVAANEEREPRKPREVPAGLLQRILADDED